MPFVSHHEVISYLPQELTEEQKKQARENIGAGKPQIQADWNQSDETALDYVKNRTHYDDTIYTLRTRQDINNILNDMGISYGSSTAEIIPGITFRVIIDGVVYDNVPIWSGCYYAGGYTWGIGDGVESRGNTKWYSTDYGFCFCGYDDSPILNSDIFPNDIESFEVYTVEKDFKYLDPKFIKDMYYEGDVAVFEEQTISGFAVIKDSLYAANMENVFAPEEGKECTVEWDGVAYDVVWEIHPEAPIIYAGNENYANMTSGGDIPFAILVSPTENLMGFVTESTAESHTVCVKELEIHYIDPKYIKDMYYEETSASIKGLNYEITVYDGISYEQTHNANIPLALGQKWNIIRTYDGGTLYENVEVQQAEDGTFYLGTPGAVSKYPFYITANESVINSGWYNAGLHKTGAINVVGASGSYSTSIIHYIDEKYLPILEEAYETVFETEEISRGTEIYVGTFDRLVGKYRVTFDGESNIVEFIDVPTERVSFYEGENYRIGTFEGNIFFRCSDDETHSLRIEKVKNVVKSEYLPDEAKAQANWNQNDETAADYIKNKPFGEDCWDTVATITGTGNSGGNLTFEMTEQEWQSAITTVGTVIAYNENNYEIAEISVGTGAYFTLTGEGIMISGRGVGTGFNWTLHLDNVSFTEGEEYTFSVLQYVELKQIDEKYIPDTIMRTPSEDDALELVAELGIAEPMTDDEGNVLTDENGALFTL